MITETSLRNWLVPVIALVVATVAVGTAQLIVAGILPSLAAEFSVDIPTAGRLISGYAFGVAIGSPILSLLTGSLRRKHLLIAVMVVFVLGNVLSAFSAAYWMLFGARVVVACCHGLIFGLATVFAAQLAPKGRQTSAVSLVVAGTAIATMAGLPLGTAIGNTFGWRASFWMIAAAGSLALLAAALLIPRSRIQQEQKFNPAAEIRAATRPIVLPPLPIRPGSPRMYR